MSENYGLVVLFHLKPGAAAGFDQLISETVPEIAKHEPGTLIYTVHQVSGQPDQRLFYELYADRGAFDAHEEQPHTRRFLAQREQYLVSHEVQFVTPVATNQSA